MVCPERPNAEIAEFDVNEAYYCCGKCLTHIALLSQLDKKKVKNYPDQPHIADIVFLLINKAQNLLHDDKDVNMIDVRAAYCANCLADLGFRLDENATILEGGGYLLYADRVMLWKEMKYLDAVTEEPAPEVPVAKKMLDSVNDDLAKTVIRRKQLTPEEQRENLRRLSEELKKFLGRYDGQVEDSTSESGSEEQETEGTMSEAGTEDLVEENPSEAGTDEQLEENTPEAKTDEQVEENTPEARNEEQVEKNTPEAVTGEPVEKNETGAGNEDPVDQN